MKTVNVLVTAKYIQYAHSTVAVEVPDDFNIKKLNDWLSEEYSDVLETVACQLDPDELELADEYDDDTDLEYTSIMHTDESPDNPAILLHLNQE